MNKNFIYRYRYLIGGGLAFAIIGVFLYKTKSKKESKTIVVEGNDIQTDGSLIYSLPKTKFDSYSIVIVFGGINYANPKWMLTETPKSLLSKAIFVYAPYTMSYDSLSPKLNDFLAKNKILVKDISILGFSAGALNVQKAPQKPFKFIGLIDPSTRSEYVSLPFTNNVKMVYNDANWGTLPKIKEALPKLAQSVKNAGGDSEKVALAHAKIPSYFFNKYKDQIA
jgi:hypothetical protein